MLPLQPAGIKEPEEGYRVKPYKIINLPETGSTNDIAKEYAVIGEENLVIVADRQTGGRGRNGRSWESQEGNLFCSILLKPKCRPEIFSLFSFVCALAVTGALEALTGNSELTLKWPNDVLLNGKKVCGILLESAIRGNETEYLIIGIGVNLLHYPEETLYPVTSIFAETDKEISRDDLLDEIVKQFEVYQSEFLGCGFAGIRNQWLQYAHNIDHTIGVNLADESTHGIFRGIDENGNLLLEISDGSISKIANGDVYGI